MCLKRLCVSFVLASLSIGVASNIGDCDFDDQSLCNWRNIQSGDYEQWRLHSGPTHSDKTGPLGDHSLNGSGYYIYHEASSPSEPNDKAWLQSPVFNVTKAPLQCIQFWYNMFGVDIGRLSLYMYQDRIKPGKVLWRLYGPQGQDWMYANVTLQSTADYSLIFEARRGDDYLGDIALDDVSVTKGDCGTLTTDTMTTPDVILG